MRKQKLLRSGIFTYPFAAGAAEKGRAVEHCVEPPDTLMPWTIPHYTGSAMNFLVTLKISKSCLSRFALRASISTPS